MTQTSCSACFDYDENVTCSWNFVAGLCGTGAMNLPFPFQTVLATKDYCGAMATCLKDINPDTMFYETLFNTWASDNDAAITTLTDCLNGTNATCTGTDWDNTKYDQVCTTGNASELCDFSTTSSWNLNVSSLFASGFNFGTQLLRKILQSSNTSNSSISSVSSSSGSSAASSSSVISSSSGSSSAASSSSVSSSVSSSASSSSVPPTTKSFSYSQSYCIPSSCSGAIGDHFKDIYQGLFKFQLPPTAEIDDKWQCATNPTPKPSGGLSGGAIAGIVIGCLVGVLLLGFLGWNMCGKSREPNEFQAM